MYMHIVIGTAGPCQFFLHFFVTLCEFNLYRDIRWRIIALSVWPWQFMDDHDLPWRVTVQSDHDNSWMIMIYHEGWQFSLTMTIHGWSWSIIDHEGWQFSLTMTIHGLIMIYHEGWQFSLTMTIHGWPCRTMKNELRALNWHIVILQTMKIYLKFGLQADKRWWKHCIVDRNDSSSTLVCACVRV